MYAVADQFGEEAVVIEHDAEDAGLAMIERAHGVEGVGSAGGSGIDGGECFGGECVGVAERDLDSERDRMADEVERSGEFRRKGHQRDVSARCLVEAVKEVDGGRL